MADAPAGDDTGDDPARIEARALAETLRGVAAALAGDDVPHAALVEAHAAARRIRTLLTGPRRARWYETDHLADPAERARARQAFFDMGPITGLANVVAPPMRRWDETGPDGARVVRAEAHLDTQYEGPPGGVHGGWVAALFDEVVGATPGVLGEACVTVSLEVRYHRLTPIRTDLAFTGRVESVDGRDVRCHATCHVGETLTAEAHARMRLVDVARLRARGGG